MSKTSIELIIKMVKGNRIVRKLPGIEPSKDQLELILFDQELKAVVEKLFNDGHYARSVEEALKFMNNLVKKMSRADPSIDGNPLMKLVFSVKNPILKINQGLTQSDKDEQLGYMEILAGCMTGIRNPRAHEHDWKDPKYRAIQILCFIDHLTERIRKSTNNMD